jgi:hypothetical protein
MEIGRNDPADPEDRPFAELQRALDAGMLSLEMDDTPRVRQYDPHYNPTSPVSREEQIRLGSLSPTPKYRRTEPRA